MGSIARTAVRRRPHHFGLRGRRGTDSDHTGADTGADSDSDHTDADSDSDAGADRSRNTRESPGVRDYFRLHNLDLGRG